MVGCALWFLNFSTWRGTHGIYLEDLYVQPAHRDRGLGRALLARLAGICTERGYTRLEWAVLDWNTPSIGFYRAIGAVPMDEWTTFRLEGDALGRAQRGSGRPASGRSRPIDQTRERSLISSMNVVPTTAPAAIPNSSWREGPSSE